MKKHSMAIKILPLILVSFFILAACGTKDSRLVKESKKLYGKQIILPLEYESLSVSGIADITDEIHKKYKIITYIDSTTCNECAFKLVKQWDDLLSDIPTHAEVGFIPVIYSYNKDEIRGLLKLFEIRMAFAV